MHCRFHLPSAPTPYNQSLYYLNLYLINAYNGGVYPLTSNFLLSSDCCDPKSMKIILTYKTDLNAQ